MYRNHEGYIDITAGKAIKRADKRKRKPKKKQRLTYLIGELECFKN